MAEVVSVTGNRFQAAAEHEGPVINAWLQGNADYHALDAVEMLLTRLHAEATRLAITEAVIDLRRLEFMNSSCFRIFISWLAEILELNEARRYKVKFLFNPDLHWQNRSLHTLRSFAVEVVDVVSAA